MGRPVLLPFFLPGSAGKLFSLYFSPPHLMAPEHFILLFPAFAEENNKSRRMTALQAKNFAAQGYGVLMVDPYGTGDSEGNLGDASWSIWCQDVEFIREWLEQRGAKNISLWGLRFGALFAMHVAPSFGDKLDRLLLWQPVIRGELMMTQFLRLRLASDMIGSGEKVTVRSLRDQLANGDKVEVAGYELSQNLVAGIDSLNMLDMVVDGLPAIDWVEVLASEDQTLSPISQKVLNAWGKENLQVHTVVGESFWTTPEIATLPALLEQTTACLREKNDRH